MKHVFWYANYLNTVILDNCQKSTFEFDYFYFDLLTLRRKLPSLYPKHLKRKSSCIAVEDGINIKIKGDEQLIDITKNVTAEAVTTRVERIRKILKCDYYLPNKENSVMKDNLSHVIAFSINRFFNSKEYCVWKNSGNSKNH